MPLHHIITPISTRRIKSHEQVLATREISNIGRLGKGGGHFPGGLNPPQLNQPHSGRRSSLRDQLRGLALSLRTDDGSPPLLLSLHHHKLLMLPTLRSSDSPLSLVIGSLCIKHPNLFGGSEKLDVSWDKGLYDSNILVAYRRPRPKWLAQQSFVLQHSLSPEIGIHGIPINNFSRSGSGGVNLSRLSVGLDLKEPASTKWSSSTSIKFEHVRPLNDDGHSISRDHDGLPLTCSGTTHDSMVVLKQESRYTKANDRSFFHFNLQIEQGIPVLSKWLIFNRFKFVASKGIKLGPAFLLTRLTGGSIVGDMAPYQAFSIGGIGSVRGYGEGAVGSGRSCLVANSELTLPLNKMLEGAIFMDCGTDLRSGHLVPGNPALRQGKPGSGVGVGYGLRFKSQFGHFQVDYAINAFQQRTLYFGLSNLAS